MRRIPDNKRNEVLELLRAHRSQAEIERRTGVCIGTQQDWAVQWRRQGLLTGFKRPGMEYTARARLLSKGYYGCIRKLYAGMRDADKVAGRRFGFQSRLEAVPFFIDSHKRPRRCAYCGAAPPSGKVWGLDRVGPSVGHIPGNLVPCCSSHEHGNYLSCQTSKSKFELSKWLEQSLSRGAGKRADPKLVATRVRAIRVLAKRLQEYGAKRNMAENARYKTR